MTTFVMVLGLELNCCQSVTDSLCILLLNLLILKLLPLPAFTIKPALFCVVLQQIECIFSIKLMVISTAMQLMTCLVLFERGGRNQDSCHGHGDRFTLMPYYHIIIKFQYSMPGGLVPSFSKSRMITLWYLRVRSHKYKSPGLSYEVCVYGHCVKNRVAWDACGHCCHLFCG